MQTTVSIFVFQHCIEMHIFTRFQLKKCRDFIESLNLLKSLSLKISSLGGMVRCVCFLEQPIIIIALPIIFSYAVRCPFLDCSKFFDVFLLLHCILYTMDLIGWSRHCVCFLSFFILIMLTIKNLLNECSLKPLSPAAFSHSII